MVTSWPIKLFWLPYGGEPPVSIYLGLVSSSFLLNKRLRRQGQGGCLVALDVNPQSPRLVPAQVEKKVAPNPDQGCKRIARYSRLARGAVKLLVADQGLESERVRPLPRRIQCGQLRSAVRSVFSQNLTPVQELSIKTTQKLELRPCRNCESDSEEILRKYKEVRFKPAESDESHLSRFKKACACIVERGWNRRKYPYIPNGHGSLGHTRLEGGNWHAEPFSRFCRTSLVMSSGKPRVVTMYSSRNVELLTPLHLSLYESLRREGWLLVGSPTNEGVRVLDRGGANGDYVSVDYQSATDNIKACYVRSMIEVLKEKSDGLTPDELAALDVLAELRLDWEDAVAVTGQPMGSPMSFPLLCLINKAVVDMSLADLLSTGKITMKEFIAHRCLINGDDLLFREFSNSRGILARILVNGGACGLVVNLEKTMVSPDWAEVNSTAFYRGEKQKKTNVAVLRQSQDVTDPIGFLADSLVRRRSFSTFIVRWRNVIASAERKLQGPIPRAFFSALWKVKDELCAVPQTRPQATNPFPVVSKPAGYDLTRGEEIASIHERRDRLREQGYIPEKPVRGPPVFKQCRTIQSALRREKPTTEDLVLKVLADRWYAKEKEKLQMENELTPPSLTTWAWDERSKVDLLIDAIRSFKNERLLCATADAGAKVPVVADAISRGDDYVPF